MQSFTNILNWSNFGTNLHCDPLAQWYGFGFAFQRYQVRACNGSKTFLFHFMSVLRAFRVRILVKMALFPQPSSVMPPALPSFSWTANNALEWMITGQYRKWVKIGFFYSFFVVLICKKYNFDFSKLPRSKSKIFL